MEHLKQMSHEQHVHVKIPLLDALNKRLAELPQFQGLQALPERWFSSMSQLTGKEYCQITRICIPAIALLLINHLKHLKAV